MIDPKNPEQFKKHFSDVAVEMKEALRQRGLAGEELEREFELSFQVYLGEVARRDFFFFMDTVLGCKGLNRDLHGRLCDFMQLSSERKLILIPRGHLKSTICTVGYALWRIINDPDIRILVANYKLENAKAFVLQMEAIIESNEFFRACYFDVIPKDKKKVKWNESQFTMRRTKVLKESTVEATGVGSEVTSKHFDLILKDDLVGPENISTKEQIDKLRAWDQQSSFLLEPGGDEVYVGTRWHYDDLYGYIMENLADQFRVFKRGIFRKKDGEPIFPEKYSLERIMRLKERMEKDPKQGKALFVAQYLNEVIDEETAYFKRGKVMEYVDGNPASAGLVSLPSSLGVTITVDPAISEKETADYSAITVRGVDKENRWFVLEAWRKRGIDPGSLIDKVFEIFLKWKEKGYTIDAVAVESIAYQKSLQYLIRDEMFKRNVFLPLQELTHGNTSKEYRIKMLMPLWENGALIVRHGATDATPDLLDEMYRYPKSVHDDLLDSLAMHMEILTAPSERRTQAERAERARDRRGMKRDRYGYPVEAGSETSYGFFFS